MELDNVTNKEYQESTELQKKISFHQTIITLLKVDIGSGLLSLPYAFCLGGYLGGVILLIMIAIMDFYSWSLMIKVLDKIQPLYEGVKEFTLNNFLEKQYGNRNVVAAISYIATIILITGANISYIIFMNQTLDQFIPEFTEIKFQVPYNIILFAFLLYFCMKNDFGSFKYLTIFATALALLVILYVIVFSSVLVAEDNNQQGVTTIAGSQLPKVAGMILYTFDINGILTEIRSSMEQPKRFRVALGTSMIIEAIAYIGFGLVGKVFLNRQGYLAFGPDTSQIITISLYDTITQQSQQIIYKALIIMYGCTLIAAIPLNFIPVFQSINAISSNYCSQDLEQSNMIRIISRTFMIVLILIIPWIFPSFASVLSILGCVCSVTLGFIIPFIIYYTIFKEDITKAKLSLNIFVLALGITGGVLGLLVNINPNILN